MAPADVLRPAPTHLTEPFWDALAREQICLPRCDGCQMLVWYPRVRCPSCMSDRFSWTAVSGMAAVYSFTIDRRADEVRGDVATVVAIVELVEGPRLTTNIVGVEPDAVFVGMRVEPVFDHAEGQVTLLRFRPAEPPQRP
jgi:uncharacterized OB-fold protein